MAPDTVPPHPAGISSDDPCLTHEHQLLRDQVRRFVDAEVKPHAEAWEREGRVPRAVFARMGELGFLGVRRAEEHGGSAMDTLASAVLAEEPGRSTFGGFAATVPVHTDMASPHLDHAGCRATSCSLAAKTDPAAKGSRGISVFAVERGTPGFGVGRALDKQGWLSSDTAELVFQDCRVPHGNLLGGENQGFYAVMRNFRNERVVLGAQAMGEAQAAIAITLDWVRQRRAFGAVLRDKQAIRHKLAMLSAKVEAARRLVCHAAWLDEQGRDCVREASMVKALCGEPVNEAMYSCQQFHGGMAASAKAPSSAWCRTRASSPSATAPPK